MTEVPNLLRPNQVTETKDEIRRLEFTLTQPDVQDRGLVQRQLKSMKETLETREPRAFGETEIDTAVKMERELREEILEGMPTQEEMRRAPSGAIGKHLTWEKRNKDKILKWKYLRQRLHAGSDNPDIANFEQFRPTGAQLDTRDALIPRTVDVFGLEHAGEGASVMSEEQSTKLKDVDPELHARMATLDAESRRKVLALVDKLENPPPKQKKNLSPEQRKEIGQRLAAARKAKREEQMAA